ncbi:hypothetical protein ILUMI_18813, partial [Ignelater luminosus]
MIMVTYLNRIKLGKFLNKIEREPYLVNTKRGGKAEEELFKKWISYKNNQYLVVMVGLTVSYFLPVVYTVIKRTTSINPQDWMLAFGPITVLNVSYSPNYEITWMYQNICMFYVALNFCQVILILAGMLAFVSAQFKMLQNNFSRIILNGYKKMMK